MVQVASLVKNNKCLSNLYLIRQRFQRSDVNWTHHTFNGWSLKRKVTVPLMIGRRDII